MKIYFLSSLALFCICLQQAQAPKTGWIIGTYHDIPIILDRTSNSLYKVNNLETPFQEGGSTEVPLLIQDSMLLSSIRLKNDENAYRLTIGKSVDKTMIIGSSVIYPAFLNKDTLLFIKSPRNDLVNSNLQAYSVQTNSTSPIQHIEGVYLYSVSGQDVIFARRAEGQRYPKANIYKQSIHSKGSEPVLLMEDIGVEDVFPSKDGRYLVYKKQPGTGGKLFLFNTEKGLEEELPDSLEEEPNQAFINTARDEVIVLGQNSMEIRIYNIPSAWNN
ncbi:MAG: hypothetical protein AAFQ68_10045 [Bacteroidota bacterium]